MQFEAFAWLFGVDNKKARSGNTLTIPRFILGDFYGA